MKLSGNTAVLLLMTTYHANQLEFSNLVSKVGQPLATDLCDTQLNLSRLACSLGIPQHLFSPGSCSLSDSQITFEQYAEYTATPKIKVAQCHFDPH